MLLKCRVRGLWSRADVLNTKASCSVTNVITNSTDLMLSRLHRRPLLLQLCSYLTSLLYSDDIMYVVCRTAVIEMLAKRLLACACTFSTSKKVKVAHTRLPSVGFRSWSRFLAVSLQVMWVINPTVSCHYFPPGPQLPPQPLRGLLPVLLLGEQRHNGCEQFA